MHLFHGYNPGAEISSLYWRIQHHDCSEGEISPVALTRKRRYSVWIHISRRHLTGGSVEKANFSSLCQIRNGSYAGWFISSWWCALHIFCMASSCSLTIYIIINSMIPVPYILLYSYLRTIYYFRIRINLTGYAPGCQNVLSQLYILKTYHVVVTRRKWDRHH